MNSLSEFIENEWKKHAKFFAEKDASGIYIKSVPLDSKDQVMRLHARVFHDVSRNLSPRTRVSLLHEGESWTFILDDR